MSLDDVWRWLAELLSCRLTRRW